ncbi:MAG: membrane-bound lytic murein transglycosylase MltF [Thermodesulfobacteriota bacterium]
MPPKHHIGSQVVLFFAIASCFFCLACSSGEKDSSLEAIKERGYITLITRNNANSYYIYRNKPAGFEYDLAKRFSEHLGVELKLITPSWDQMIPKLNQGEGDFIAAGLTITEKRKEKVDFSQGYLTVQQQIVLHRGDRAIKDISDLDGKTVHVRSGTTYEERLEELNQREDMNIDIERHDDLPTEELIRRVDRKRIRITVADSNIAMLNRRYYPSIRIAFPIEEEQSLGWAVHKGNTQMLQEINSFLDKIEDSGFFAKIHERYYADVHIFDYVDLIKYHQRLETRLPRFKTIIKKHAQKHGFDWKLIAAVIYQESYFDPNARSYTGVRGLMQVTQITAREMGITNRMDPEQSVQAGVKYLARLYDRWEEISGLNRFKFALASYNVGYGHVRDAQKIARQEGYDPQQWSGLKKALPLLRIQKYYSQTRYGYARGTEPVRYIKRIMKYYNILKQREDIAAGA